LLVSVTFTVIVGTVLLSGLGARPLARRLGIVGDRPAPIILLGSNPVAVALAETLEQHGFPVRLVSLDRREVSTARLSGLAAVRASVLDDELWSEVAESGASTFAAMTSSDEANVLACRRMATLIGRRNVFRVVTGRKEHSGLGSSSGTAGRPLFGGATLAHLGTLLEEGWRFRVTPLTDAFDGSAYRLAHPESQVAGVIRSGSVDLVASDRPIRLRPGDEVIGLAPEPRRVT
jgi:TrkA-N domain